jgi:hypothetical protein
MQDTRWFKYDRDDLCVNKSQFVPVIFEPPCTNSVEQNPSWEANLFLATQETPRILWKPNVH